MTVSLPYEPGRAAFASLAPHAGGPRLARRRPDRGAPGPRRGVRPRRARPSRAPSLRRHAAGRPAARRRGPLLRGRRRARLARADGRGDPGARRGGHAAGGDRPRRPVGRALARAARDRARHARDPVRDRGPRPARPDAVRAGAAGAAALRVAAAAAAATSTPTCARRSPGFTRSNVDFLEGRLRGRGVSTRDTRRGGDDQAPRRQPLPPLEALRSATGPVAAVRAIGRRDAARRPRPRGAAGGRGEPRRPARLRRDRAPARRARRLAGARRRALARTRCSRALERAEVRIGSAGEPGRVAVLDLMRARTRRFEAVFLLGLEEGTLPRRGNASPFLDDDARGELDRHSPGPARAARPGRARPLPLLHRLHARDAPAHARPRGGDRRGQPARAEPVLGRGRRALRARGRAPLDAPAAALAAHLGARGRADRARAAARARAALAGGAAGRRGPRARERLGAAARRARGAPSRARRS